MSAQTVVVALGLDLVLAELMNLGLDVEPLPRDYGGPKGLLKDKFCRLINEREKKKKKKKRNKEEKKEKTSDRLPFLVLMIYC